MICHRRWVDTIKPHQKRINIALIWRVDNGRTDGIENGVEDEIEGGEPVLEIVRGHSKKIPVGVCRVT